LMRERVFVTMTRYVIGVSIGLCLCMSQQALRAGSYVATFSGGTVTGSDGGYTASGNVYGGGDGAGGGTGIYAASCSGTLTATMTWDPDGPQDSPPASVVVAKYSAASWSYTATPATGTVNDGQGDSNSETYPACGVSKTTYFVLTNPGTSFTETCSPSVSITLQPGWTKHCQVEFEVTTYPVTVGLTGPTLSAGTYEALTGTQIVAKLSAAYTVSGWQWAAPGGGAFKNFSPSATSNQYVTLGASDYTGSSLTFYDASSETISLTCSATVTAPDGTVLAVTGAADPITSVKPTATWGVDPATLPVIVGGTVTTQPTTIGFYDHSGVDGTYGAGTVWYPVVITVPSPFTGGTGCFAQTVTPIDTLTRTPTGSGASTYTLKIPGPGGTWVSPGTGLDTGWPYPSGFTTDSSGDITGVAASSSWTLSGSGTSSIGASGDNPHGQESATDVDSGGMNWQSSSISDSFTTWLMYQPTSANSVWVPIMKATWSASGNATGGPASWVATGSYSAPSPGNASDFPQWSTVIVNQEYRP